MCCRHSGSYTDKQVISHNESLDRYENQVSKERNQMSKRSILCWVTAVLLMSTAIVRAADVINYVLFTNLVSADGTLTVQCRPRGQKGNGPLIINAFQLVDNTAPMPKSPDKPNRDASRKRRKPSTNQTWGGQYIDLAILVE